MKNIHGNFGLVIYFHVPKLQNTGYKVENNIELTEKEIMTLSFMHYLINLVMMFQYKLLISIYVILIVVSINRKRGRRHEQYTRIIRLYK